MPNVKAREGQWYSDRATHDVFCVIAVDEDVGYVDVRDLYGDIDEFDFDEWEAMDLELCSAPQEWNADEWSTDAPDTPGGETAPRTGETPTAGQAGEKGDRTGDRVPGQSQS